MTNTAEDKDPKVIEVEKYSSALVARISLQAEARIEAIKRKWNCSTSEAIDFLVEFQYFYWDAEATCAEVYFTKGKDYFMTVEGRLEIKDRIEKRRKG